MSLLLAGGGAPPVPPNLPWRFQETRLRPEAEEFRRVSEDGWSLFRPYLPVVVVAPSWTIGYVARRGDFPLPDLWPSTEQSFRPFFRQTRLAPWRTVPDRQAVEAETFRKVGDDIAAFRWFFPQTRLAPWREIPSRQPIEAEGFSRNTDQPFIWFFPRVRLHRPQDFTETRWAVGEEGFRRVSDFGWDAFRPFWTAPAVVVTVLLFNYEE